MAILIIGGGGMGFNVSIKELTALKIPELFIEKCVGNAVKQQLPVKEIVITLKLKQLPCKGILSRALMLEKSHQCTPPIAIV